MCYYDCPITKLAQMKTRIMYIEHKGDDLTGEARTGCVRFFKSGKSILYRSQTFHSLKGAGYKANYCDAETEEDYWISGCRKDGADRLYVERLPIHIDKDVQEEYWKEIRNMPEMVGKTITLIAPKQFD